jgi:hypothetical protein
VLERIDNLGPNGGPEIRKSLPQGVGGTLMRGAMAHAED